MAVTTRVLITPRVTIGAIRHGAPASAAHSGGEAARSLTEERVRPEERRSWEKVGEGGRGGRRSGR